MSENKKSTTVHQEERARNQPPKDVTEGSERFEDFSYHSYPGQISTVYQEADNTFLYQSDNGFALKVQVFSEDILRFRFASGPFARDFSYALDPGRKWEMPRLTTGGDDTHFFLSTGNLICKVAKKDMKVSIFGHSGKTPICEDSSPFEFQSSIMKGIEKLIIRKEAPEGESYYGLGDKTCNLNLRGAKLENWNTDSFAFTKEMDPLYRTIPFYYVLNEGRGYGIFLHNSSKSHFDFDSEDEGVLSFWVEDGEMDYFFINGPRLLDVARRYVELTGLPELPPIWTFGYHQSRWSYFPESRVREIAKEFRSKQIPCDALYLDIDYMDGYRCFTWNKNHFPDPARLIADLGELGFQTIVMIDPGIRVDPDYHVYREGLEKDVFCRRSSGELMTGPVWPPHCVFPDFTNPEVRTWWHELYRELYVDQGVSGFWNDMNEPALFKVKHKTFPDNVLHDFDGDPCDHQKGHNVYGQQMSRATYEGLKKLCPKKRPFVLTRASFSGGQRFASLWTGDNRATWEHLRLSNIQCQRLSLSGFSLVGADIGGFAGNPDGELFVRWLQLGVFHPLYRVHSMGNNVDGAAETDAEAIKESETENRLDQEPWSFGEKYTELARRAINFRYELLPYLYTSFWQHVNEGIPLLKSLAFFDQHDKNSRDRENEFIAGDHILVSPVVEPGLIKQEVYLPEGTWFDYWTGIPYQGRQTVKMELQADRLPIFANAGAVIPNYPVQQYIGEKQFETIGLRVYHGHNQKSYLYEDEGEGYGYQNGIFSLRTLVIDGNKDQLMVTQEKEGSYQTGYTGFEVHVFGLPFAVTQVLADAKKVPFEEKAERGHIAFTVRENFTTLNII